jgi:hypothetical protein
MCSLDGRSGTNKGGLTHRILWNERENTRNGGLSQVASLEKENEQAWPDHWYAEDYAATAIRLANASGISLRSDGAILSSGFVACPISSATQHVGIF